MRTVLDIQRRLMELGFDPGPLDGIWGPKTEAAVLAFKRACGIPVNGPGVDADTDARLFGTKGPAASGEPLWMHVARSLKGQREIKGSRHNPLIVRMWEKLMLPFRDDETSWCFPGDHEILTERGWVRFDELSGERVFQSDENGTMSLTDYEPVTKAYDGDAFVVNHRSVRMTCDVGHRWWGHWTKNRNLEFRTLGTSRLTALASRPSGQAQKVSISPTTSYAWSPLSSRTAKTSIRTASARGCPGPLSSKSRSSARSTR